ncbi:DNA mismatch repair protein MutS [Methanolapillus millepedarum]|uniref:DNA mismatch repair protein MutS n=1 Tax=Methanolapillus millepedarum TaxID=3028296 RepID=A0AA96V375_9EURY|nr:DNA mismatch repair protein MutS [Methanosarcinaceae archaeon Ac7]
MDQSTPAMRQYYEAKKECPDALVFFRMGDFYESFGDDAKIISKELEITLTNRGKTIEGQKMPLAGIPYHAIDTYLPRLIKKGYKVAICEQLENPKEAKGVVKRGIVRVVTPGTAIDTSIITDSANNYLMAISGSFKDKNENKSESKGENENKDDDGKEAERKEKVEKKDSKTGKTEPAAETFGIAFLDISTGEFLTAQFEDAAPYEKVMSEVAKFRPSECILQPNLLKNSVLSSRLADHKIKTDAFLMSKNFATEVKLAEEELNVQFKTSTLDGMGLRGNDYAVLAAGKALSYALETQMRELEHIHSVRTYSTSDSMVLDSMALRNLEIVKNVRDEETNYSLIRILDKTKTSMGSRLLRNWLLRPLLSPADIQKRLNAVEFLKENNLLRFDLRKCLSEISDMERLVSRMIYGNSNARDLISMRNSLLKIPEIAHLLDTNLLGNESAMMADIRDQLIGFDFYEELIDLITNAIEDEPPITVREGKMIKFGYNQELDELRNVAGDSKDWIAKFQADERERTGIKSLKVGYNKVFGYFIEITNSNKNAVPDNYIRKQTMANGERYYTPELKERESLILSADDRAIAIEYEIFREITVRVAEHAKDIQKIAQLVAQTDVLSGFAEAALENNYICPEVDDSFEILIRDGRHPIVEKATNDAKTVKMSRETFVPNDTEMDCVENQFLLITGPNMAGKSTYMRQVAMIVIMAQAGSFVPAAYAKIGIVDRIFTRIGAYDDLAAGKSTFMVEMVELSNILNNSDERSLILLDEIGRGTSTYDGYSIAKAVVEFIHNKDKKGIRTLFATHYHQLTALENKLKRLKNFHIAVLETGKELVFLRKIIPGATDKSYGIHVAKLAGVPDKVIERSSEILRELENESMIEAESESDGKRKRTSARYTQLLLVDPSVESGQIVEKIVEKTVEKYVPDPKAEEIKCELAELDVDHMTPVEALLKLGEIKKKMLN